MPCVSSGRTSWSRKSPSACCACCGRRERLTRGKSGKSAEPAGHVPPTWHLTQASFVLLRSGAPPPALPHGGSHAREPSKGNEAGRRKLPGRAQRTSSLPAAMIAVLEPAVPTIVADRSISPAFAMGVLEAVTMIIVAEPEMPRAVVRRLMPPPRRILLEAVTMIIVAEPEMPRVVVRRLMPPRPRRMVLEPGWPRLRSEVAAWPMPVMHDLGAVMQVDAEIERGHHIRVDRGVPVGGCLGRQHGDGAKRDGEKKMPVHGSSSMRVHEHARACNAPFERRLIVLFTGHSADPK